MATPKHKLDIFGVLGNISRKDSAFYDKLTEEEQKALMPLVVMRWLTGTSDARQLYFLNELVNPLVFNLTNHKKLLVQLMGVCTSGSSRKHTWMKAKPRTSSSTPNITSVIKQHFNYSTRHAIEAIPLLCDTDILEYAEQLGRQPDVIKLIKKELKKR